MAHILEVRVDQTAPQSCAQIEISLFSAQIHIIFSYPIRHKNKCYLEEVDNTKSLQLIFQVFIYDICNSVKTISRQCQEIKICF